ncbi:hypothetical protein OF83DRAFT_717970 [Amylostereum chailletii]|nr:hypothetical protein OF83DRAFT_717970 [Amylostereum chailletii]
MRRMAVLRASSPSRPPSDPRPPGLAFFYVPTITQRQAWIPLASARKKRPTECLRRRPWPALPRIFFNLRLGSLQAHRRGSYHDRSPPPPPPPPLPLPYQSPGPQRVPSPENTRRHQKRRGKNERKKNIRTRTFTRFSPRALHALPLKFRASLISPSPGSVRAPSSCRFQNPRTGPPPPPFEIRLRHAHRRPYLFYGGPGWTRVDQGGRICGGEIYITPDPPRLALHWPSSFLPSIRAPVPTPLHAHRA